MTPDQEAQCKVLGSLWGESPDELWQWWLDAEEDGSTWPSFYADMLEYAPRRGGASLFRVVSYHTFRRRLERGWTREEALRTPPRAYPASQSAQRAAADAASCGNLRKARASLAAARAQRSCS